MHFCLTIDHRSFADQRIAEQPTSHEGYIVQNMEKKGMIADHCEINRQIRADNQMLRELKTQVSKLAQAVKHSIPVIAETMETIRNHMIFTQYHLLHNEMQKEVIHDWMNHFNPILNKYNTVKKELKGMFGKYYDYHRRDIAANEVDYLNVEDPDVFSHRAWELKYQREQEIRRNQPARTKKKSYDIEL